MSSPQEPECRAQGLKAQLFWGYVFAARVHHRRVADGWKLGAKAERQSLETISATLFSA